MFLNTRDTNTLNALYLILLRRISRQINMTSGNDVLNDIIQFENGYFINTPFVQLKRKIQLLLTFVANFNLFNGCKKELPKFKYI